MPGYLSVRPWEWADIVAPPPAAPSTRLYLLNSWDNTFHKSSDDGATWADITPGGGFYPQVFDVVGGSGGNDLVVLIAQGGGVRTSADGGATWATKTDWTSSPFASPDDVAIIDASIYIIAQTASQRTTDGGTTWADDPVEALGYTFPQAATGGTKLWCYENNDQTRRTLLNGTSDAVFDFSAYNVSPVKGVVSDALAFQIGTDLVNSQELFLLELYGTTITDIWPSAAMDRGVAFSCWSNADRSIYIVNVWDRNVNSVTKPDLGQILRSTNQGASWTVVSEGADLKPLDTNQGKGIAVDPSDPLKWWVIGGQGYDSGDAKLFASADGGQNWTSSTPVVGSRRLNIIRAVSG